MSEWSTVKPVTPEVKHICLQMKSQVESKTETNFAIYIPVDFISKNEGGVNYTYIVKVNVGDKCVHPKIFQDGGGDLIVQDAHYPKTIDDPLVPF